MRLHGEDQIAQGPAGLRLLAFSAGGLSLAACFMEMLHVESHLAKEWLKG